MERRPLHRLLEVRDEHVGADLLAAEVALHQGLVLGLLDDRLDQGGPLLDGVALRVLPVDQAGEADQGAALVDRQEDREHLVSERGLGLRENARVVGPGVVELGHHHRARHRHLGALLPQPGGRVVDALVGGDHEERAVGGAEPGAELADEVGVPGGVDEVDLGAVVAHRRDGQAHGSAVCALGVLEVRHRGAVDDRARPGDGARGGEQRLQEGGLAGGAGPDQDDVANPVGPGRFEVVAGRSCSGLVCHGPTLLQPGRPHNPQCRPCRRRRVSISAWQRSCCSTTPRA